MSKAVDETARCRIAEELRSHDVDTRISQIEGKVSRLQRIDNRPLAVVVLRAKTTLKPMPKTLAYGSLDLGKSSQPYKPAII
jgi:hypothetical protein